MKQQVLNIKVEKYYLYLNEFINKCKKRAKPCHSKKSYDYTYTNALSSAE